MDFSIYPLEHSSVVLNSLSLLKQRFPSYRYVSSNQSGITYICSGRIGNRPAGFGTVRPVLKPSVVKAGSENRLQVVPRAFAKMEVDSTKDGNRFKMLL